MWSSFPPILAPLHYKYPKATSRSNTGPPKHKHPSNLSPLSSLPFTKNSPKTLPTCSTRHVHHSRRLLLPQPNLAVILGAADTQGSSVVSALLFSATMATSYHLRALTRTPTSPAALALSSRPGIDVAFADANEPASLDQAFAGAHAIFAVTDFASSFQALSSSATAAM